MKEFVEPRTRRVEVVQKGIGRQRLRFYLRQGGLVEIKLGDQIDRSLTDVCPSCRFRQDCEEAFGDYVRVGADLILYFCYLRRDLGFPISEYLNHPQELKGKLVEFFGDRIGQVLATTPIRLTVTPFCNFCCRPPGSSQTWCTERIGSRDHDLIYSDPMKGDI